MITMVIHPGDLILESRPDRLGVVVSFSPIMGEENLGKL